MHKLGVEEWLVSAVTFMYTGAKTVVRTAYGNSNSFEVKVDMHQGSALSPLLFVIVMDLIKRLNEWKDNVENTGMRVNMNKTKVMISGERQKVMQKDVRWPCRVYGTGIGSNSIQCTTCQKWVHRKCSGIKVACTK